MATEKNTPLTPACNSMSTNTKRCATATHDRQPKSPLGRHIPREKTCSSAGIPLCAPALGYVGARWSMPWLHVPQRAALTSIRQCGPPLVWSFAFSPTCGILYRRNFVAMQWEGLLRVALSTAPFGESKDFWSQKKAPENERDPFQIQPNNFHKNPQTGEAVNCSKQADGSKRRSRLLLAPCNIEQT